MGARVTAPDRADTWVEVVVRATLADAEQIADVLRDVAPDGISIEPVIRSSDTDDFSYEILDGPCIVRAALPGPFGPAQRRDLRRRLSWLVLAEPLAPLRYRAVPPDEWLHAWKRHFHVLHVGRIVVRPTWEPYTAAPGEVVIDLDPGRAFGTGQHQTTRLCLAAVDTHMQPGAEVIDLGAGSGILGIAAARLGAAHVRALDVDAETVPAAQENAQRNGVDAVMQCATGSLGAAWPWPDAAERCADLLLANITWVALVELMPAIARALRPGGVFVGSGFVEERVPRVLDALATAGLAHVETTTDGEWRCIVARRAD